MGEKPKGERHALAWRCVQRVSRRPPVGAPTACTHATSTTRVVCASVLGPSAPASWGRAGRARDRGDRVWEDGRGRRRLGARTWRWAFRQSTDERRPTETPEGTTNADSSMSRGGPVAPATTMSCRRLSVARACKRRGADVIGPRMRPEGIEAQAACFPAAGPNPLRRLARLG